MAKASKIGIALLILIAILGIRLNHRIERQSESISAMEGRLGALQDEVGYSPDPLPTEDGSLTCFGSLTFNTTPNEVTFRTGVENELICDATEQEWLRAVYELLSDEPPSGDVSLRFELQNAVGNLQDVDDIAPHLPDPNDKWAVAYFAQEDAEMDEAIAIEVARDMQGVIDAIPAWPHYVELPKDLIVEFPNDSNGPMISAPRYLFPKGTRIYFERSE